MSKLTIRTHITHMNELYFETVYIDPKLIQTLVKVNGKFNSERVFCINGKMVVIKLSDKSSVSFNKSNNSMTIHLYGNINNISPGVSYDLVELKTEDNYQLIPTILEAFKQFAQTGYFQAKEERVLTNEHTYSF